MLVNQLPPEVLSRVLLFGIVDDQEAPLRASTLRLRPPSIMTSCLVCKWWRDIAMDTPVLWQRIIIRGLSSLQTTRLWLLRSKATPLDVLIGTDDYISTSDIDQIMETLLPHASRWREVILSIVPLEPALRFVARLPMAAPQLSSLSVSSDRPSLPVLNTGSLPSIPTSYPAIRHLRISGVVISWADVPLMSTLTSFELGYHWHNPPTPSQLLRLLQPCSQTLSTLRLRGSGPFGVDRPPLPSSTHIICPKVLNLAYECLTPTQLSSALRFIITPNVRRLYIGEMLGDGHEFSTPLREIGMGFQASVSGDLRRIAPLFPHVTNLELGIIDLPPTLEGAQAFGMLLGSMKKVKSASINFSELNPRADFLNMLMVPAIIQGSSAEENELPFPDLASLEPIGLEYAELRHLLTTREQAGYPLGHLILDGKIARSGTQFFLQYGHAPLGKEEEEHERIIDDLLAITENDDEEDEGIKIDFVERFSDEDSEGENAARVA